MRIISMRDSVRASIRRTDVMSGVDPGTAVSREIHMLTKFHSYQHHRAETLHQHNHRLSNIKHLYGKVSGLIPPPIVSGISLPPYAHTTNHAFRIDTPVPAFHIGDPILQDGNELRSVSHNERVDL